MRSPGRATAFVLCLALACSLLSLVASAQVIRPRLTEDHNTLILLDEIQAPPKKRQPLVTLELTPKSGARYIRVAGRGMFAPATVKLRCGTRTWRLGRSLVSILPSRNVAFFGVKKEVADAALTWPRCRLLLVGVQIPIPRDLMWAVWADPSKGEKAPRLLEGDVLSVIDGDTIRVQIQNRVENVRYLGITTPEVRHPTRGEEAGGREATVMNNSLVEGKTVRLELDVRERDQLGRLLAYVYAGDLMVNAELVERGYAQVMSAPPNVRYEDLLLRLQREARKERRGLWAERESPPVARTPAEPRQRRPGVAPLSAWVCPATHPIKGNFTTYSGERCIYHTPRGQFYNKTKPERCYATKEEGRRDGCRQSRR